MLSIEKKIKIMDEAIALGWKKIHPSGDRIIGINPKSGMFDEIPGQEKVRR